MKRHVLLFTTLVGFLYVTLSSYQNGTTFKAQTANRTQGPGSSGGCGGTGCHDNSNATLGTVSLQVRKKTAGPTSAPVTMYQNDSVYTVTVKVTHPSLMSYGMQVEVLDTADASAGMLTAKHKTRIDTINSIAIVSHDVTVPKADSSVFEWKAPSSDSGAITFYGAVAITDQNGNPLGDSVLQMSNVALSWTPATNISRINDNSFGFSVSPNPVRSNLNIGLKNAAVGVYNVSAYDMNGRKLYERKLSVNNANATTSINTSEWAAGAYIVYIATENSYKMVTVIKQ